MRKIILAFLICLVSLTAHAKPNKASSWFTTTKNGERMVVSFDVLPKINTDKQGNSVILTANGDFTYKIPEIPKEFKDNFLKIEKSGATITVQIKDGAEVAISRVKTRVYLDVKTKKGKEDAGPITKAASDVKFDRDGDLETLTFSFEKPVAAAGFERFGYYWLVFDSSENKALDMDDIKSSAILEGVEKVKSDSQVFKLALKDTVNTKILKSGNSWKVQFDPNLETPLKNPLKVDYLNYKTNVNLKNAGKKIQVMDDFTGDNLTVIPSTDEAGVLEAQEKPDIEFGQTNQGVVFRELGKEPASVEMLPEGISVAIAAPAVTEPPKPKGPVNPVFKFEKWKQFSGDEFRKEREKATKLGNYALGKFLFTQGFYSEAADVLKTESDFTGQFLSGASYYMAGKYDRANEKLSGLIVPPGGDEDELNLWKATAEFAMSEAKPSKQMIFRVPPNFSIPKSLSNYPTEIAAPLITDMSERTLVEGSTANALGYLKSMPKDAPANLKQYASFIEGLAYDREGKRARATEIWTPLAAAVENRKVRARAQYYLTLQDLDQKKLTPIQVGEKLEKIRPIWRGDRFEYNLLKRLADIYFDSGSNISALRIYREAVVNFPGVAENDQITEKMRTSYISALSQDFTTPGKAFESVALYYEFEELKPAGEEGDKLTLDLADKLAEFDLVEDAGKLISKQLDRVVDPEEKALLSTRVAILKFMNRDPKGALDTLNKTEDKDTPAYIQEERDLLAVRSMIELGQTTTAMQLLPKIPSEKANILRAEIFWKDKKWNELVEIHDVISQKTPADIMKVAVAAALTNNGDKLDDLKKQYSEMMKKSEYADSFQFIADNGELDYHNLPVSLNLEAAKTVTAEYKNKLITNKLKNFVPRPVEKKPEPPKPAAEPKKEEKKSGH